MGHSHHQKTCTHGHHHGPFGERAELFVAIASGVFLLVGWLLSFLPAISPWIPWGFYLAAYFCGGLFTTREAIESISHGKFDIDFLMLLAAVGAAILGHWAEGALLLFLFSLGHALEHYAMGRAKKAIEALGRLTPHTATVRRDGEESEIPLDELQVGDTVLIKPNERMPADGFVSHGHSSVDQWPITGESVPVDKRSVDNVDAAADSPEALSDEHRIFAGTINGSGSLEVIATRRAEDTTLARVVTMVAEAQSQRSPTQQFTDRFQRIFVPAVLTLVVALMFVPIFMAETGEDTWSARFYRSMAVLVAASPCALAISTPSAVLSAVARAARGGVLVKGGGPLEALGHLRSIAFDKTGTLTQGTPRVVDVAALDGVTEDELLSVAVAVERLSDHPLAAAVVEFGESQLAERQRLHADELENRAGQGVSALLDGERVEIGKRTLFQNDDLSALPSDVDELAEQLEASGRTTMIVRRGERFLGVLGLMDTPREEAHSVIAQLRGLGIERMVMISGDNQRVASAVAEAVGLDQARGDLMPQDKVAMVQELRDQGDVAMVGDGVNDAPAMASATVGIAMGAAGSGVALETADIALMADSLKQLPFAVGLSRRTSGIIRQNLWISLGMVALLVPATIFGLAIGPAVALHEGSTLIVVFNALRLLVYRS